MFDAVSSNTCAGNPRDVLEDRCVYVDAEKCLDAFLHVLLTEADLATIAGSGGPRVPDDVQEGDQELTKRQADAQAGLESSPAQDEQREWVTLLKWFGATDLNGDGFEDLAWASGGTWRYMLGGAAGYGAAANSTITATNPSKALPLDWNGDGFMDLLVDWSDGKWRVLKGTAAGFASPVHAGPGTGIPSNTANSSWWIADADGDGRDDLLRSWNGLPATVYLRLNGGTGLGAEVQAFSDANLKFIGNPFPQLGARNQSAVRQPDFDGDGRPDLFWLNNDSPSRAYLNRSDGNRVTVVMPDAVSALGARVHLEGEGAHYTLEVASASGLGADQSPDLVFGLGVAQRAERLVISWADGRATVIEDPPVNRPLRIGPPDARAEDAVR